MVLQGVGGFSSHKRDGLRELFSANVGGPVTALPVMGVFLTMFKKRVLALYLTLCVGGTLVLERSFAYPAALLRQAGVDPEAPRIALLLDGVERLRGRRWFPVSPPELDRAGIDPQEIGCCYIGSESHPYAVKPSGTVVAEAVGVTVRLPRRTAAVPRRGSRRPRRDEVRAR